MDEEAEEEAVYLSTLVNNDPLPMFTKRKEDCFKLLILRHLMKNEIKFREYFRVSTELLYEILNHWFPIALWGGGNYMLFAKY